jgi:hypothetical protein
MLKNGVMLTMAQQLALRTAAYAINNFPVQRALSQYERVTGQAVTQSV